MYIECVVIWFGCTKWQKKKRKYWIFFKEPIERHKSFMVELCKSFEEVKQRPIRICVENETNKQKKNMNKKQF